jgi:alkylhydroperoxidase family enzyme
MVTLHEVPLDEGEWAGLRGLFSEVADSFAQLHSVVWELVDPVLLELCRLRMAGLLGFKSGLALRSDPARRAGLTEDRIGALPSWPTSSLFSERERAALAMTEQFVIDPNGVDDALAARLLEHMDATEVYTFVNALWAVEALQRASLTLGLAAARPEQGWPGITPSAGNSQ